MAGGPGGRRRLRGKTGKLEAHSLLHLCTNHTGTRAAYRPEAAQCASPGEGGKSYDSGLGRSFLRVATPPSNQRRSSAARVSVRTGRGSLRRHTRVVVPSVQPRPWAEAARAALSVRLVPTHEAIAARALIPPAPEQERSKMPTCAERGLRVDSAPKPRVKTLPQKANACVRGPAARSSLRSHTSWRCSARWLFNMRFKLS